MTKNIQMPQPNHDNNAFEKLKEWTGKHQATQETRKKLHKLWLPEDLNPVMDEIIQDTQKQAQPIIKKLVPNMTLNWGEAEEGNIKMGHIAFQLVHEASGKSLEVQIPYNADQNEIEAAIKEAKMEEAEKIKAQMNQANKAA